MLEVGAGQALQDHGRERAVLRLDGRRQELGQGYAPLSEQPVPADGPADHLPILGQTHPSDDPTAVGQRDVVDVVPRPGGEPRDVARLDAEQAADRVAGVGLGRGGVRHANSCSMMAGRRRGVGAGVRASHEEQPP